MRHGCLTNGFASPQGLARGSQCITLLDVPIVRATGKLTFGERNHSVAGIPEGLLASLHAVNRGLGRTNTGADSRLTPAGLKKDLNRVCWLHGCQHIHY